MDGVERARQFRRNMSPAERRLWTQLRAKPGGFKFRKQHPEEPYTLDFFCHEAGLAVEVDGASHEMGDNPEPDERRDKALAEKGIKTLRFLATDIRDELEAVVTQILQECASRSPLHHASHGPPPPESRGRRE